jgi:hypothetical protein
MKDSSLGLHEVLNSNNTDSCKTSNIPYGADMSAELD